MASQLFYRSSAVPIEIRMSQNSQACYGKHAHKEFSIGAVDCGCSYYLNRNTERKIQAGSLVIINPLDIHSCNPIPNTNWSYKMMYVCPEWLGYIQSMVLGKETAHFIPFSVSYSDVTELYIQYQALAEALFLDSDGLEIEEKSISFFSNLFLSSNNLYLEKVAPKMSVAKAYDYIYANFQSDISIKDIAEAAQLSEYHVIHAFRRNYGITPHAMQIVMRINEARIRLRQGGNIAAVASELGFHDQSHFHRHFKKLVAATPAEYKKSVNSTL